METLTEKPKKKMVEITDDLHSRLSAIKGKKRITFTQLIDAALDAYEEQELENLKDIDLEG